MRKIRELLRLKHELGRSHREIAGSLGVSSSTVSYSLRRAREAGVSWPLPEGLDDAALEAALYPAPPSSRAARPEPDWKRVHRELQRHKGVTLRLLWLEYLGSHPDGYRYSRFCQRYREWRGRADVVMRQVYRAGEKAFVDYAGLKFEIADGESILATGLDQTDDEVTLTLPGDHANIRGSGYYALSSNGRES